MKENGLHQEPEVVAGHKVLHADFGEPAHEHYLLRKRVYAEIVNSVRKYNEEKNYNQILLHVTKKAGGSVPQSWNRSSNQGHPWAGWNT